MLEYRERERERDEDTSGFNEIIFNLRFQHEDSIDAVPFVKRLYSKVAMVPFEVSLSFLVMLG